MTFFDCVVSIWSTTLVAIQPTCFGSGCLYTSLDFH